MNDALSIAGLGAASLAQLVAPTPNALFTWLGCLAFVLVIIKYAMDVWRGATGRFEERGGTGERRPTQKECDARHSSIDATLKQMNHDHATRTEALRMEIKTDVNNLYNTIRVGNESELSRFERLMTALHEVRGEVKHLANGKDHDQ